MGSKTVRKAEAIKKGRIHINKSRSISEIFDIVSQQESNEEKAAMLRAYASKGLLYIINGMYNVDWSGMKIPKYKPNHRPPEICALNIHNSIPRIESAYRNRFNNPKVTEKNLLIVLEEVSKEDAELLVNMFKGGKVKGISKSVFRQSFPCVVYDEKKNQTDEDQEGPQKEQEE